MEGLSGASLGGTIAQKQRESREVETLIKFAHEANQRAAAISGQLKGMKHRLLGLSDPQQIEKAKAEAPTPVHCELKEMRLALDKLHGWLNEIASDVDALDRI